MEQMTSSASPQYSSGGAVPQVHEKCTELPNTPLHQTDCATLAGTSPQTRAFCTDATTPQRRWLAIFNPSGGQPPYGFKSRPGHPDQGNVFPSFAEIGLRVSLSRGSLHRVTKQRAEVVEIPGLT